MKIHIKGFEKEQAIGSMKRIGYTCLGRGNDEAEFSFVRSLGSGGYPRFHALVRFDQGKDAILNIHLDQRKTVYAGVRAHNADYDGSVLEQEVERIKSFLENE